MAEAQRRCGSCRKSIVQVNEKTGKSYQRCERCRASRKILTDRHRAAGICRDCKGQANGKARCTACIRKIKARLRATGRCQNCGCELTRPVSICRRCALKGVALKRLGARARWIELDELLTSQGNRCALSGLPIETCQGASLDHIMPTARGGDDTLDNLRFTHLVPNRMKGSLKDGEFLAWIEVLAWYAHQRGLLPATMRPPSEDTIKLALSVGGRPKGEKVAYGTYKRCGGPS